MLARTCIAASLCALAACGWRESGRPPSPDGLGHGRAALAAVTVHNLTSYPLRVAYWHAVGDPASVGIGTVAAGTALTLAPIPAGEPIVLTLQDPAGRTFSLPPRTFEIGAEWRWTVPADARFVEGARR